MLDAAERALQVAQAVGDAGLAVLAQERRGEALWRVGRLEEAASELAAVLAVLPLSDVKVDTLNNLGFALAYLGRPEEAQAVFERGLAIAEQKRFSHLEALMAACCGSSAFERGDWPAARHYIERALTLAGQMGTSSNRWPLAYLIDGLLQLAQGQLEAATRSAETGLALAEQRGDELILLMQRVLTEIDLAKGDPTSARVRMSPFLDRAHLTERDIDALLPVLVWAQLDLGEVEAAEELAAQTVARLRAQHHRDFLVDALQVEAAIWIRQQRWDEAEAALQEALALARPMPYPYAEAKALSTYGDLLVASGHPEQARDQYAAALAILRRLGEVPYTERIERALAEMARH